MIIVIALQIILFLL